VASADRTPFKDFFNPSSAAASKADALVAAVADVAAAADAPADAPSVQAEFSVDNHFHPQ
jgi:hypothetical protein